MIVQIKTIKTVGTEPVPVTVECEITNGIGIHLVGLADAAVKESLLRTVTAIQSMGCRIPAKKMVINIAPANLNKKESGYDLPFALGILTASGQKEIKDLDKWIVLGEVGLDSTLRSVPGAVQAVIQTLKDEYKGCILPMNNAMDVAEIFGDGAPVYGAGSIQEAIDIMNETENHPTAWERLSETPDEDIRPSDTAWDGLVGNEIARRAIEIAAAGGHSIILVGPPGSQKSTIAKALAEILPPMTSREVIETAKIRSVSGRPASRYAEGPSRHPFRAPHFTTSLAALIGGGGGDAVLPGELSLASNGVLFLDEFDKFPAPVREALRGPLEDKKVTICRLKHKTDFPADFQMVFACNPCPCGYYGEGDKCSCTPSQRLNYMSKLDGPILDHVAIQVWAHPVKPGMKTTAKENIEDVRTRVLKAREIQAERFHERDCATNDRMNTRDIEDFCHLSSDCEKLIENLMTGLGLSARAYSRILRIARTIADLAGEKDILPAHLAEASSFRFLDRRTPFDAE